MEIISFDDPERQEHLLAQIGEADWSAGRFLFRLLKENRFRELAGDTAKVLLLTDGGRLASFCTYAERDDIPDTGLKPWMGFVYTFPEYRGRGLMGKLLSRVKELAREDGYDALYVSTREEGLYEKYGAGFFAKMKDAEGKDSNVFRFDTYGFEGWEQADAPALTAEYRGIRTPKELYCALWHVWSAETCAPRMRQDWSGENRTLGQCSVTAFLAQDIFGGNVYGIPLGDGNYHCYNAAGGCVFDLTSEQFPGERLCYSGNPEQSREEHFRKDEKRERYEKLKKALKAYCAADTRR